MEYWVTKQGEKISIKKLDDNHLLNCIKMLEKSYDDCNGIIMYGVVDDQGSPDYYDEEHYKSAKEMYPKLKALYKEKERRGL